MLARWYLRVDEHPLTALSTRLPFFAVYSHRSVHMPISLRRCAGKGDKSAAVARRSYQHRRPWNFDALTALKLGPHVKRHCAGHAKARFRHTHNSFALTCRCDKILRLPTKKAPRGQEKRRKMQEDIVKALRLPRNINIAFGFDPPAFGFDPLRNATPVTFWHGSRSVSTPCTLKGP